MSEGAYFPNCWCDASTFTSSALATLATGAYPQVHGIVAERWFNGSGIVEARAEQMLADVLTGQTGNRRVFVYGSSPAEARLLAGKTARQVVASDARGKIVPVGEAPSWLDEFNELRPAGKLRNARWMALGAGISAPPLRVLSYDASRPEEFYWRYRSSPFAQSTEFDFLRSWITRDRLAQTGSPDMLIATLAPMAALGYEVGAESPLMREMVLHLDREIEVTLDTLNRWVGPGNYSFIISAAHGAPTIPGDAAKAVSGEAVAGAIDAALSRSFDGGAARNRYVGRYVYPFLYLSPDALRRGAAQVRAAAAKAAMALPQVAGYYTADRQCSFSGAWERRFRNSFHTERSGDLMLAYRPGCIEYYGAGRGISYGSLYNYDTRVPLLLLGPQFRARTFENRVESIDIAPTLARALGVAPPPSSTGRVLGEALAEAPRQKK